MKILHVVTLHTPSVAFGGPLRVAVRQAQGLRGRGHDVRIVAAVRGWEQRPAEIEGVPLISGQAHPLLPVAGFSGLFSPTLLARFATLLGWADVVHVHFCRDLVTLPAALMTMARHRPLVVQTHGMVEVSGRRLARPLDAVATRRVLRRADHVLYLTEHERSHLERVARRPLPTALQVTNGMSAQPAGRDEPDPPRVLFAARLHPRKRPLAFVEAAVALLREGVRAQFLLIGPDGGEATAVRRAIDGSGAADRIRYLGPVEPDQVLTWMRASDVYVLPSVNEPYPLTVLESLSVGTPVVITSGCQLAPDVTESRAGLITDGTVADLAKAIRVLLEEGANPLLRAVRSDAAVRAVAERFDIGAVLDRLDGVYRDVVEGSATVGTVSRS